MHLPPRSSVAAAACTALALSLGACGGGSHENTPARAAPAADRAALVVVPDVTGKSMDTAHRALRRAGLTFTPVFPGGYSSGYNEVPCVKIASQAPAAGELRPRGASVRIVEVTCRKAYPPRGKGSWP
ncbi:MAG TPA: PASTA domain-containing protein [Solirubrobacteraceae bacterium]|nr:PASTA domain-containing protein [Solirubrobacteraceae bacterium]